MFQHAADRLNTKTKRAVAVGLAALLVLTGTAGARAAIGGGTVGLLYTTDAASVGTAGEKLSHATLNGTVYIYLTSPSISQVRFYVDDATGTSTALTATTNPFVLNDNGSSCAAGGATTAPATGTATGGATTGTTTTGGSTTGATTGGATGGKTGGTTGGGSTAADEDTKSEDSGSKDDESSSSSDEEDSGEDDSAEFKFKRIVSMSNEEADADTDTGSKGTGNGVSTKTEEESGGATTGGSTTGGATTGGTGTGSTMPATGTGAGATMPSAGAGTSTGAALPATGAAGTLVGLDTTCLQNGVHIVLAEITSTSGKVTDLFARFMVDNTGGGTVAPPAPTTGTDTGAATGAGTATTPAGTGAAPGGDEGKNAAAFGWGAPSASEEFDDDSGMSWYESPGHEHGNRSAANTSVANGIVSLHGKSGGQTAGGVVETLPSVQYGRWEARVKVDGEAGCWRPLFLLWPTAENWPVGGEVDWMEGGGGSLDEINFFLHYGADNSQTSGSVQVDMTQWNDFAVEWTPQHIKGFLNGKQWFEDTDTGHLPPGPMHPTIQLDGSPDCGATTTQNVDWYRYYPV